MNASRVAQMAAIGALLAIPSSAYALSSAQRSRTKQSPSMKISARPLRHRIAYGQSTVVSGMVPRKLAGARMALEYVAAGTDRWRTVARETLAPNGHFALQAPIVRSGRVRVVAAPLALPLRSPAAPISVGASFHVARRLVSASLGQPLTLNGWLLPGTPGRQVRLLSGSGRRWTQLAESRTGRYGGFRLRYELSASGAHRLRVSFAGDRTNRGAWAPAGGVVGLTPAVASWYYDGGHTACGFHARYGIASRTLPCGAQVTLSYLGRTVTATVDDRGPYVYGREFDLDQSTAAALGMYGVATILTSAQ